VAAEAAPQMELTSEAPEKPAALTPVAVEEAPTPAAVVEDASTPADADEKSEEAKEVAADEQMETKAKDVTPAMTEPIDTAAVTKHKAVIEDTPANEATAPSVPAPNKTETGTMLKPRGRETASQNIEPAVVVIQEQNMKE
jgi:translation initiation factor IF-2